MGFKYFLSRASLSLSCSQGGKLRGTSCALNVYNMHTPRLACLARANPDHTATATARPRRLTAPVAFISGRNIIRKPES